jgi:O-antigen ligase
MQTGPLYAWQGDSQKLYHDIVIRRALGFSESPNLAGGIAATLALFSLLAYRPGRRILGPLCVAGLMVTLSRGAIAGFLLALTAITLGVAFRPLIGAPMSKMRTAISTRTVVLCAAVPLLILLLWSSLAIILPVAERLALDDAYRSHDIEMRLNLWQAGLRRWWNAYSLPQQLFGAGLKSGGYSGGTYSTSHSLYIEILLDFGAFGLMLFMALLIVSMARFTCALIRRPNHLLTFALAGLVALITHNATEVFLYDPSSVIMLILLLTCGELALREHRNLVALRRYALPATKVNRFPHARRDQITFNNDRVA